MVSILIYLVTKVWTRMAIAEVIKNENYLEYDRYQFFDSVEFL